LPDTYVVADLGCGTGEMTARLSPYVKHVFGVDNSPAMLKAAKKRVEGLTNVDLRRGELELLPIDDASVDAAVMTLALSYVPAPVVVMKEMSRILKPGGRAVLVDLLPHDRDDFRRQFGQQCRGFAPAEVGLLFDHAGFGHVTCSPLAPEADAKGPALFLATGTKEHRRAGAPNG